MLALVGGVLLVSSSFLNVFEVTDLAGHAIPDAATTGNDSHGPALVVIGIVIIVATFGARWTAQPLPSLAAAALGILALVIVGAGDLPDAYRSELVRSGLAGSSRPATGLWVELAGAMLTTVASVSLAWMLHRSTARG